MRGILIPATLTDPMSLVEVDGWESMALAISAPYIERVRVGTQWALVVDESGLYRQRNRLNHRASNLYAGVIFGDALLLAEGEVMVDGYPEIDFIDARPEEAWAFLAERGIG